jgi:trimeric autotransporter adhesin
MSRLSMPISCLPESGMTPARDIRRNRWTRALGFFLCVLTISLPCTNLQAAVFTVTSTADTGGSTCAATCTLRQAINAANGDVFADTIQFAITTSGPFVITPATPLPTIVNSVMIDGYTQTGAVANTSATTFNGSLRIQLSGTSLPVGSIGLKAQPSFGSVVIRGLSITGFSGVSGTGSIGRAIQATGAGAVDIRGCLLGLTPGGGLAPNHTAIEIAAGQTGAVSIGSSGATTLASRNVISGNSNFGVLIRAGASTTSILNNLIGTDRGVLNAQGNGSAGISALRANTTLRDNVIAGNGIGVILQATDFVLTGNKIGIAPDVIAGPTISNGTGVVLNASSPAGRGTIGGAGALVNLIFGNTGDGIEDFAGGLNIAFAQNRFHANGGLAIDLRGTDGPTANDIGDGDVGPNGLQNTPIITSATRDQDPNLGPTPITISGTLNSLPNRNFRIHFHGNATGSGSDDEGKYLAPESVDISTDGNGNASFGPVLANFELLTNVVTASATLLDATDQSPLATSELSPGETVVQVSPTVVAIVTSTADPGDGVCDTQCTLREAILAVTGNFGTQIDPIRFDIPGPGPHTIVLESPLPAIPPNTLIDGYTQTGASPNTDTSGVGSNAVLKIEVTAAPGLDIAMVDIPSDGANITLRGLSITGFKPPPGLTGNIGLSGANSHVEGCWFGVRPDGSEVLSNFLLTIGGAGSAFGGDNPAQRNLWVNERNMQTVDAPVLNNLFGILPDGRSPALVSLFTDLTLQNRARALSVGGTQRPLISNNVFSTPQGAVAIEVVDPADIIDNAFGESADGATPLPLGSALRTETNGVLLRSASHRIRGPLDTAIAFGIVPLAEGIGSSIIDQAIVDGSAGGVSVFSGLSHVSIRSPISTLALGIDLLIGNEDEFGVTPNDFNGTDNDQGPNDAQNFPDLISAVRSGNQILVEGNLRSTPNSTYRIMICGVQSVPASSHGGCDQILDDLTFVNSDAQGDAPFQISVADVPGLTAVSATASLVLTPEVDELTSEFALDIPIVQSDVLFADGFE